MNKEEMLKQAKETKDIYWLLNKLSINSYKIKFDTCTIFKLTHKDLSVVAKDKNIPYFFKLESGKAYGIDGDIYLKIGTSNLGSPYTSLEYLKEWDKNSYSFTSIYNSDSSFRRYSPRFGECMWVVLDNDNSEPVVAYNSDEIINKFEKYLPEDIIRDIYFEKNIDNVCRKLYNCNYEQLKQIEEILSKEIK